VCTRDNSSLEASTREPLLNIDEEPPDGQVFGSYELSRGFSKRPL
jgi:hypothetical protein